MPVVFTVINRPASQLPSDASVVVELVGEHGKRVAGYVATSDLTIEGAYRPTIDSNFRWEATLVANSLISPAGTVYKATERVDDVTTTAYFTMPATGGPYHILDILTEVPSTIVPPPVAVETARAEAAEAALATALLQETARADAALIPTAVKTGNYTAVAQDAVPCDTTSGSFTVTLPNAPADKTRVWVKQVIQGGTNTVTVACAGSDVFNKTGGATTLTLTLLAQAVMLQYKAIGGIWYVQADDLPLSQLDSRYASYLSLAANPDAIIVGAITRDGNGAATSAGVVWPDGTTGTYTADTVSTSVPGAVDAYHVTYGSTRTYTQPAVTRDSTTGAVTARPALVVT